MKAWLIVMAVLGEKQMVAALEMRLIVGGNEVNRGCGGGADGNSCETEADDDGCRGNNDGSSCGDEIEGDDIKDEADGGGCGGEIDCGGVVDGE